MVVVFVPFTSVMVISVPSSVFSTSTVGEKPLVPPLSFNIETSS